ncbi:hypothetical protein IFM89_036923 [Coptis chinensis]|uniref:Uncharacterized protein n=1 Tax=Coptis chinensis TaxID=261450 RepID=A0A835HXJ9_9MAGN|nr:hypothetical protein IFM89_036923 [Coptis chinensis]
METFTLHSDNDEEEELEEDPVQFRSKGKMLTCDKSFGKETRKRFRGRTPCSGTELQLKRPKLDYVNLKAPKSHTLPFYKPIKAVADKRTQKEVISAICKFFYHAGVPVNVASSPYFYRMLELVGQYGQGLKGLSIPLISAYFLNPCYRYRPDFVEHTEATRGNNECIVRLEPDSSRRVSASMQISDFRLAKADFGTELAVSTRTELDPVETEKEALQEDEILYNEMEQPEADDEVYENEERNLGVRKGPMDMLTFEDVVEPLETHTASDDEDDLDFLDDLTD